MRHTDATPGWIKRRFAKIEKWQREQSAARRMEAATIGKGGITIKDGGSFVSKYPAVLGGGEGMRLGPHVGEDAEAGYAIQLNDELGNIIFAATRSTPTVDAPAGLSGVFATGSLFFDDAAGTGITVFGGDVELDAVGSVRLVGTAGTKITHSTTGASANCFIDPSDGRIWRSTSSRRYKQDIEDVEIDPAAVLNMRGVTFRDKGQVEADPDTETRYVGFIAEELHDLGLTQFVDYDGEGRPDAIAYDRLTVALLAVLKDQQGRIEALESADEAPAEP